MQIICPPIDWLFQLKPVRVILGIFGFENLNPREHLAGCMVAVILSLLVWGSVIHTAAYARPTGICTKGAKLCLAKAKSQSQPCLLIDRRTGGTIIGHYTTRSGGVTACVAPKIKR